jgi:Periplasmic protease
MTGRRIAKKVLKILLIGLILLAILAAVGYFFFDPYLGSTEDWQEQNVKLQRTLTKKQALDDLNFIKDKVGALHYSARNGLSSAFKKQYEKEIAGLSDKPTVLSVWRAGCRILHTLNDGHSTIYAYLDARSYSKANYSIAGNAVYIKLNNRSFRVEKICGADINLLRQNGSAQFSYENSIYRDYRFLSDLKVDAGLEFLGCPPFGQYTVAYDDNGRTRTVTIPRDQNSENSTAEKWVGYRIDKPDNVGIFTLNSCNDNDEYRKTLHNFFAAVKKSGVTNVAVDLRENGGGNSLVLNDFIRYLNVGRYQYFTSYHRLKLISFKDPFSATVENSRITDLLFKGKVYVLTSPETFSSAMQFSVVLQDNGLAKVIGEPSGNKPSQYGKVVTFLLPNIKMYFSTTYAYFERPDKTKVNAAYQVPDYPVSSAKAVDRLCEITRGAGR